jgi:hypothetical protein
MLSANWEVASHEKIRSFAVLKRILFVDGEREKNEEGVMRKQNWWGTHPSEVSLRVTSLRLMPNFLARSRARMKGGSLASFTFFSLHQTHVTQRQSTPTASKELPWMKESHGGGAVCLFTERQARQRAGWHEWPCTEAGRSHPPQSAWLR